MYTSCTSCWGCPLHTASIRGPLVPVTSWLPTTGCGAVAQEREGQVMDTPGSVRRATPDPAVTSWRDAPVMLPVHTFQRGPQRLDGLSSGAWPAALHHRQCCWRRSQAAMPCCDGGQSVPHNKVTPRTSPSAPDPWPVGLDPPGDCLLVASRALQAPARPRTRQLPDVPSMVGDPVTWTVWS